MIIEGESVRCAGKFRGRPCERFLGVFVAVYGGIKCSRCGTWNELRLDKRVEAIGVVAAH